MFHLLTVAYRPFLRTILAVRNYEHSPICAMAPVSGPSSSLFVDYVLLRLSNRQKSATSAAHWEVDDQVYPSAGTGMEAVGSHVQLFIARPSVRPV
jgi:hypothetical protein